MGLNSASWGYIDSIYPGSVLGLLSTTQDEVCDVFKKLAWDAYAFDQAKSNFGYPPHSESVFPVRPYPQDHFLDSYAHLTLVCLLFSVIIVSHPLMMPIIAHIVIILMLLV